MIPFTIVSPSSLLLAPAAAAAADSSSPRGAIDATARRSYHPKPQARGADSMTKTNAVGSVGIVEAMGTDRL